MLSIAVVLHRDVGLLGISFHLGYVAIVNHSTEFKLVLHFTLFIRI